MSSGVRNGEGLEAGSTLTTILEELASNTVTTDESYPLVLFYNANRVVKLRPSVRSRVILYCVKRLRPAYRDCFFEDNNSQGH